MTPDPRTRASTPAPAVTPPGDDYTDVPPELLDADPDPAAVNPPGPPPSAADLGAVPPDVLYQLREVQRQLAEANADVKSVFDALAGEIRGRVSAATGLAAGVLHEVAGVVGVRLSDVSRPAAGVVTRVERELRKRLDGASAELRGVGVGVPYDPAEWLMLADAPEAEWLPFVVPAIGEAMGAFEPPAVDCTKFPDDPACKPGGGDTGGGSPPPPPPPLHVCADGITIVTDPRHCPENQGGGTSPPPPPPPPVECPVCHETTCRPSCPAPLVQCPTIPPIVIPPPVVVVQPGGGQCPVPPPPDPPHPWGPPPVEVDVDVIIPPDPDDDDTSEGIPPAGDPGKGKETASLNWAAADGCRNVQTITDAITYVAGSDDPLDVIASVTLDPIFDGISSAWDSIFGERIESTEDGFRNLSASVMSAPTTLVNVGEQLVQDVLHDLGGESVPNPAAAAVYGVKLMLAGFAERQTSFPCMYLRQAETYAFQYSNPQYLPPQHAVDTMFLYSRIDEETWTCWTKAHGNIPDHWRKYRDLQVGRPTMDQLIQLRLRKRLTREEFYDAAARIGWSNTTNAGHAFDLATQIPTQSDLLRMMVRDAADEAVVKKYDYDKDFELKFTGAMKDWAEAQGIPAEIFKFYWRAHWEIPSNTQLYEMFQRLRPDRPEVQGWDACALRHGPDLAAEMCGPRPAVVTIEDVKYALQVNDKAPAWIDSLLQISYHPITRTDAIRAYTIGAFDRDQLYHAFRDNGYNARDAQTLVDFQTQATIRQEANATGVLTIRKTIRLFKDGALSRIEAFTTLEPLLADPERRNKLLDRAEVELKAEVRQIRLKGLQKRFVAGEDMPGGWAAAITAVTQDAATAARILERWNALYYQRLREPTARMLCTWYKDSVISAEDMWKRLFNLGYSATDAELIVGSCDKQKVAALRKAIETAQAKAKREQEKRLKEIKAEQERRCHPPKPCWDGSPAP